MSRILLPLGLSLTLVGCLSPNNSGGGGSDGDSATGVSIYDIQQGLVEEDALVTVTGIVTTPLFAGGEAFMIQDPQGGPWSGLYIYLQGSFTDLYISEGDLIEVTGTVVEYYDLTELTVTSSTDIAVVGTGEALPTVIDGSEDMEQFESVLVKVENQTVLECKNQYGEAATTSGIDLDDLVYEYETERDAQYESITGVVTYSFEEWKLLPRSANDFQGYTAGSGCSSTVAEAQESGVSGYVELTEVVVTSDQTDEGAFWVQDAGGGPWSGVYVYLYEDVAAAVSVNRGDVINIAGSMVEFYDLTELTVGSAGDVEVVGSATPSADLLTEAPADWETYEGCLITLDAPTATSDESQYGEVETDYGIKLDDDLYDYSIASGEGFETITGLVTYSYEEWKLLPRDALDLSGGNGGGDPTPASVAEVQTGVTGTVQLTGVIATTGTNLSGDGFFVQDDGGGEWSGVYIYSDAVGDLGINEGDVLDITGSVTEYYDLTEIVISDASDVVVTGSGSPTAYAVASAPADWESLEGVLITAQGLSLTGDPDEYGESPTDWGDLVLDDMFWDYSGTYSNGASLGDVTGVVTYAYEDWRLAPRASGDIQD